MAALRSAKLAEFRSTVLRHWHERLPVAATTAGREGQDRVLAEIEAMAREDDTLTQLDLVMLADMMLVGAANPSTRP